MGCHMHSNMPLCNSRELTESPQHSIVTQSEAVMAKTYFCSAQAAPRIIGQRPIDPRSHTPSSYLTLMSDKGPPGCTSEVELVLEPVDRCFGIYDTVGILRRICKPYCRWVPEYDGMQDMRRATNNMQQPT